MYGQVPSGRNQRADTNGTLESDSFSPRWTGELNRGVAERKRHPRQSKNLSDLLSQIRGSQAQGIVRGSSSSWWAVLGSNQGPLPCEGVCGCDWAGDRRIWRRRYVNGFSARTPVGAKWATLRETTMRS